MIGSNLLFFKNWHVTTLFQSTTLGLFWQSTRASRASILYILRYAFLVLVPVFKVSSVFGFALLVNMIIQMLSGFLLSLYYIPDPTFVMTFREEYMNEVWWFIYVYKAHVVGVDSIFVLSYLHIFKKLFIKNFIGGNIDGWVTGSYAFLIYHAVVFLGITLSSNHLGDLTLTIGANIFWSIFLFQHKTYAPIFTNRHLNVDQLSRFMIGHYVIAWYYFYLVQVHVMFVHEMWDLESTASAPQDQYSPKGNWLIDAMQREASVMVFLYIFIMTYFTYLSHMTTRPVDFNFFEQWSEVEMEDINFFIVGPHWYFRPHMGLLTICANHYEGVLWLAAYYGILAFLPLFSRLANSKDQLTYLYLTTIPMRHSLLQFSLFVIFLGSIIYVGGTLPCARFYYDGEEGFFGNSLLRVSYQYVYLYLSCIMHWADRFERFIKSANLEISHQPTN